MSVPRAPEETCTLDLEDKSLQSLKYVDPYRGWSLGVVFLQDCDKFLRVYFQDFNGKETVWQGLVPCMRKLVVSFTSNVKSYTSPPIYTAFRLT